ncbi:MAG: PorT family protein [Muribaculaceae bacterium]|nr:PorT family protein [Muribaculaceae bacterium]
MSHFFRSFIVLIALAAGMTAQAAEPHTDSAHFGVRASFDYNNTTSCTNVVKAGPGASVGAIYYAPFGKITYFNMGLMFFYDTFNYDGYTGEDVSLAHIDGYLSMLGLKLPLQLGVKYYQSDKISASVYTGPQFYYNFSMRSKFTRLRAGDTEEIDRTINSAGMDLGWGIGAAVEIHRHWHVHVEYNIGLNDFTSLNDIEIGKLGQLKRSELSVGIGYNF